MTWSFLNEGKGLSSLIGGQILAHSSWEIPDLFIATAATCSTLATIVLVNYHVMIKNKSEKTVIEKKAKLMEEAEKKRKAVTAEEASDDKSVSNDNNSPKMHPQLQKTILGQMRRDSSFFNAIELSGIGMDRDANISTKL